MNKFNLIFSAIVLGFSANAYSSISYETYLFNVDGLSKKGKSKIDVLLLKKNGSLYILSSDLKKVYPSLKTTTTPITHDGEQYYAIKDLGELNIDDATLEASLVLNPSLMPEQNFNLLGSRYKTLPSKEGSGARLNYIFNYDINKKELYSVLSPSYYNNGDVYYANFANSSDRGFEVLDLNYRTRLGNDRVMQLGTNISKGNRLNSSNRFVGVSLSKNWDLEQYDISSQYYSFNGSSEVAGVAELYMNGNKIMQQEIDRGNYSFEGINNNLLGGGQMELVVRDNAGRVTTKTIDIIGRPMNLKKGFTDYSLSAGYLRSGNNHIGDGFVSGEIDYGLTDNLTVSAYLEASKNVQNATLGATYATSFGTFQGSISQGEGSASNLGYYYSNNSFYFNAEYNKFDNFKGVGSTYVRDYEQFSAAASIEVLRDKYLNFRYFKLGDRYGYGVGANFNINQNISANVSINKNSGGKPFAYVGLNFYFDRSANLSSRYNGDSKNYSNRLSGSNITNTFNYYLENNSGSSRNANNAYARYSNNYGEYSANFYQSKGGDLQGNLSTSGSIVGYNGNVHFSRLINSSYAVIDLGEEGIPINSSAGYRGKTNSDGVLIFPVAPLLENNIYINANDLSDDLLLEQQTYSFNAYPDAPYIIDIDLKAAGFFLEIPDHKTLQSIQINNERVFSIDGAYYIEGLKSGVHEFVLDGKKYSFDTSNVKAMQKIQAKLLTF